MLSGLRQFSIYFVFSGFAALVNIGSRFVFSTVFLFPFPVSVTVAYCLGMVANYLLNRNFNFPKGPRGVIHEIRTFFIVAIFGLFLTNGLALLFKALFDYLVGNMLNLKGIEMAAHITAVGLTAIYSFFAHKHFTYRQGIRQEIRVLFHKFLHRNEIKS